MQDKQPCGGSNSAVDFSKYGPAAQPAPGAKKHKAKCPSCRGWVSARALASGWKINRHMPVRQIGW